MRVSLLLAALLALAGPALACDPILLELIRGQDRSSAFDTAVQNISTKLNDVAGLARAADWVKGLSLLSEVERDWVGVYGSYYLSKPANDSDKRDWQATFDFVSQQLAELEKWYKARDFERLHPLVRAVQDRLIRFYRARSPNTPPKLFERAAGFARSLATRASAAGVQPRDLGETFVYLEQEVGRLPEVQTPGRAAMMTEMRACQTAVRERKDVAGAARKVEQAIEKYRQESLEKLWFASPPGERKDVKQ